MSKTNLSDEIMRPEFDNVEFLYKEKLYIFSGWWMLEDVNGNNIKDYLTKEDFLEDKCFDGKTLREIEDDIEVEFLQIKDY